jgi:hypothetical protein
MTGYYELAQASCYNDSIMETPNPDAIEPIATATAAPAPPKPAAPVMDIRLPDAPDNATAVHEAPKADTDSKPADVASEKQKANKPAKPVKPKTKRQAGVGGAIFASVVIVLGLAALAVYAYLKSRNIALF